MTGPSALRPPADRHKVPVKPGNPPLAERTATAQGEHQTYRAAGGRQLLADKAAAENLTGEQWGAMNELSRPALAMLGAGHTASMHDDLFPVEWMGRRAIVAFPGHVDVSNVGQLRDRLLSVINRGAAVLIVDMTDTVSCDHSAVDAVAQACQRAAISGTQLRLVVTAPVIRRVLSIEGLDRLVSIYPSREAAIASGVPGGSVPAPLEAGPRPPSRTPADFASASDAMGITPAVLWQLIDALGDGLVLAGKDGKIALVNRRCAEMFGYKREDLIGLPVDSLVPSDVRAAHVGYRAGYSQAPQARPMGERARLAGLRKDGATLPVEISLSPVPTATENFVLAVIRDATEARRGGDLADLARSAVADHSHRTKDLLDRVVRYLFEVGLSLQAASNLPGDVARERLTEALEQLDDTIHEIRDYAFTSGDEGPRSETGPPAGAA